MQFSNFMNREFVIGISTSGLIAFVLCAVMFLYPLISLAYSNCPTINRTLVRGSSGADVSLLQQLLAQDSTVYPEALVTGYFGTLTERAVQRWQAQQGIVSSGSPATTGYGLIGPRTRAAMSAICKTTSNPINTVLGPSQPLVASSIKLLSPNGGAVLNIGDRVQIKWQWSSGPGDFDVHAMLVRADGLVIDRSIAYNQARIGTSRDEQWIVGKDAWNIAMPDVTPGQYKIRVTGTQQCYNCRGPIYDSSGTATDESDGWFTIH